MLTTCMPIYLFAGLTGAVPCAEQAAQADLGLRSGSVPVAPWGSSLCYHSAADGVVLIL